MLENDQYLKFLLFPHRKNIQVEKAQFKESISLGTVAQVEWGMRGHLAIVAATVRGLIGFAIW